MNVIASHHGWPCQDRGQRQSAFTSVTLGEVANAQFAIARVEDIMFNVIGRMWRRNAVMTIVVRADGIRGPTASSD